MRNFLMAVLCLLITMQASAQVDHWESIILAEDTWHYHPGTTAPDPQWKSDGFDDSGWLSGPGGIGYGDGDDNTVISPVLSLYLRTEFTIVDKAAIEKILLQADFDDGFIAYLNGTEIAHSGFSNTEGEPAYDQPVDQLREAQMYQGGLPENFRLDADAFQLLKNGTNTLAIQVHNHDISSSDMSALFYLFAGMKDPGSTYRTLPSFFQAPVSLQQTTLPIITIDTRGNTIVDEPRIIARMQVIDNGPGAVNLTDDLPTDYDGQIAIEIRGSSSQMFPKKSYRLELQDEAGENNNVSLLGMPAENDWVLYAPYSDKTFLRNVLTFYLGRKLGHYAPRTRFVELVINDDYRGVYVLMENIKRDDNRVDLANLRAEDISGDELTGGYILKVDRPDPEGGNWQGYYPNGSAYHQYQIVYPKPPDIRNEQLTYIQNFMRDFEDMIYQGRMYDQAFTQIFDEPSFVNFFLINEFTLNVDAYRLSAFFYKKKITNGGKLYAGPLWDFNLAFGNADYCEAWKTTGWVFRGECDGGVPFFWPELIGHERFINSVQDRWQSLRREIITEEYLHAWIDSVTVALHDAQDRNYRRWPVLGQYVWPNYYVGDSFQDEVDYLKEWISQRLIQLDTQIGNLEPVFDYNDLLAYPVQMYPNPFSTGLNIKYAVPVPGMVRVEITDTAGRQIFSENLGRQDVGYYHYIWPGETDGDVTRSAGPYFIRITRDGVPLGIRQVIRQD